MILSPEGVKVLQNKPASAVGVGLTLQRGVVLGVQVSTVQPVHPCRDSGSGCVRRVRCSALRAIPIYFPP